VVWSGGWTWSRSVLPNFIKRAYHSRFSQTERIRADIWNGISSKFQVFN
jgi:hypothetical protein